MTDYRGEPVPEQDRPPGGRFRVGSHPAARAVVCALLAGLLGLPLSAAPDRTMQAQGEGDEPEPMVIMIPPSGEHRPPETPTADPVDIMKEPRRQRGRRARDRAEIAADYRDVLLVLSAGGRDAGLTGLFEFETGFMAEREPGEVERLLEAEIEVIRWLGVRDLEAVVPLLALHHDAYRLYIERGEPFLAGHSSRLAASVADLYAREGDSEGSRILGASALASLGIYAQKSGVKLQSVGLMLHALELDPDNEAALLGLASVQERSGNYHRAAEHLLALLQAHPGHREGRLRMAVNLDRLGSRGDAVSLFDALAAEPENDWVAAVALQELARIHRQEGRLDRAEEVLWSGLERLPDNGRLRTQLALVLDLRRLPRRALSVIQELPQESERIEGPSARRRYGMGPQEAFERVRAALDESAESRVGRLAELLGATDVQAPAGGAP